MIHKFNQVFSREDNPAEGGDFVAGGALRRPSCSSCRGSALRGMPYHYTASYMRIEVLSFVRSSRRRARSTQRGKRSLPLCLRDPGELCGPQFRRGAAPIPRAGALPSITHPLQAVGNASVIGGKGPCRGGKPHSFRRGTRLPQPGGGQAGVPACRSTPRDAGRAGRPWNVMGRMPMPRHITTRPSFSSSLRLCAFALSSPPPLLSLPQLPTPPISEGLRPRPHCS